MSTTLLPLPFSTAHSEYSPVTLLDVTHVKVGCDQVGEDVTRRLPIFRSNVLDNNAGKLLAELDHFGSEAFAHDPRRTPPASPTLNRDYFFTPLKLIKMSDKSISIDTKENLVEVRKILKKNVK